MLFMATASCQRYRVILLMDKRTAALIS